MAETEADVVHTVFDWYTRTGMSNGEIASEHNKRQRRVKEAEKADPLRLREQSLYREQARMQNKVDRLLTAYQEELIALEQLRQRMPDLRPIPSPFGIQFLWGTPPPNPRLQLHPPPIPPGF